jgi:hypothetical protein
MPRTLAALLALALSIPAHATLVAVVPSRDGVAVAADSRLTFLGAQCDGAFKLIVPAQPSRTVAVVTGDAIFVAPPPSGADPCKYMETAPRLLDMNAVVADALSKTGPNPARISMAEVSQACLRAVREFDRRYPGVLKPYAGREIFSVVLVSYDAALKKATLRNFVVRMDSTGHRAAAGRVTETTLDGKSTRDIWVYGETGWMSKAVYNGAGRRFLSPATLAFLAERRPIGEVSLNEAGAVAGNIVEAASRTAEIDRPPSGIGGQVHVIAIGAQAEPQWLAWASGR